MKKLWISNVILISYFAVACGEMKATVSGSTNKVSESAKSGTDQTNGEPAPTPNPSPSPTPNPTPTTQPATPASCFVPKPTQAELDNVVVTPPAMRGEYKDIQEMTFDTYVARANLEGQYTGQELQNVLAAIRQQFEDWKKGIHDAAWASARESARAQLFANALNRRYRCLRGGTYDPCFPDARQNASIDLSDEGMTAYAGVGVSCVMNGQPRAYVGKSPDPQRFIQ